MIYPYTSYRSAITRHQKTNLEHGTRGFFRGALNIITREYSRHQKNGTLVLDAIDDLVLKAKVTHVLTELVHVRPELMAEPELLALEGTLSSSLEELAKAVSSSTRKEVILLADEYDHPLSASETATKADHERVSQLVFPFNVSDRRLS